VHFAIIMAVNLTVGLLTPADGAGAVRHLGRLGLRVETIARAVLPFLAWKSRDLPDHLFPGADADGSALAGFV
jgi:hypothetical protein